MSFTDYSLVPSRDCRELCLTSPSDRTNSRSSLSSYSAAPSRFSVETLSCGSTSSDYGATPSSPALSAYGATPASSRSVNYLMADSFKRAVAQAPSREIYGTPYIPDSLRPATLHDAGIRPSYLMGAPFEAVADAPSAELYIDVSRVSLEMPESDSSDKRSPEQLTKLFKSSVEKVQTLVRGKAGVPEGTATKILEEAIWLEATLPEHPFSHETMDLFKIWAATPTAEASFEEWLCKNRSIVPGAPSRIIDQIPKVAYLSEEERKKYEVECKEGVLVREGKPFLTEETSTHFGSGRAIYVISTDGKLYAGSQELGKFHHSSFCSGAPVQGAGELRTDATGKLVQINNLSGHYKPSSEQLLTTIRSLKERGVDISDVEVVEALPIEKEERNAFSCHYSSAAAYLESEGKISPDQIKIINKPGSVLLSENQITALRSMQEKGTNLETVPVVQECPEYSLVYSAHKAVISGQRAPSTIEIQLDEGLSRPNGKHILLLLNLRSEGCDLEQIDLVVKDAFGVCTPYRSAAAYLTSLGF